MYVGTPPRALGRILGSAAWGVVTRRLLPPPAFDTRPGHGLTFEAVTPLSQDLEPISRLTTYSGMTANILSFLYHHPRIVVFTTIAASAVAVVYILT